MLQAGLARGCITRRTALPDYLPEDGWLIEHHGSKRTFRFGFFVVFIHLLVFTARIWRRYRFVIVSVVSRLKGSGWWDWCLIRDVI